MSSKSNSALDFFLFNVNCPRLGCFALEVGVRGWKFGSDSASRFSWIISGPSRSLKCRDMCRLESESLDRKTKGRKKPEKGFGIGNGEKGGEQLSCESEETKKSESQRCQDKMQQNGEEGRGNTFSP